MSDSNCSYEIIILLQFGKGVYFADMSSKSANYCYPTRAKNIGLVLLCEVNNSFFLLLFFPSFLIMFGSSNNGIFDSDGHNFKSTCMSRAHIYVEKDG